MTQTIGIPKEVAELEHRVAATPESVEKIINLGFRVVIEDGAGEVAGFSNECYLESGAEIIDSAAKLYQQADIIIKIQSPNEGEFNIIPNGKTLISFIWPQQNQDLLNTLKEKNITTLAIDSIPRISRAQKMDVLSAMSNIAGYRAVVEAAHQFGRFFTGQITAAGKVPPAKVLVIGAGVAGLSAIGAARGLGAIVRAFDTRPQVKEQVESMGAEFLELDFEEDADGGGGYAKEMSQAFIDAEMALFAKQAMEVDIIITTALIPGKPAPKLISSGMVESMKTGSVIVDLASEQGGNCALTEPNQIKEAYGVKIIGFTNIPSRIPNQSSLLYANNIVHLLTELTPHKDGLVDINFDDEVIRAATVVKDDSITWPPPEVKLSKVAAPKSEKDTTSPVTEVVKPVKKKQSLGIAIGFWAVVACALFGLGSVAPKAFLSHLNVFVLACFIGWQVIWNVTAALHTPLMSVTNAISGIIVIGALLEVSGSGSSIVTVLAAIAILIASVNIFGGFYVTQRMLKMFRK